MKLQVRMVIPVCVAAWSATACTSGDFALVGLNREGRAFERFAASANYSEKLQTVLEDLQEQSIPVLEANDYKRGDHEWVLRRAMIGAGLEGSIGLGEFVKLGGTVGFRIILSNVAPP